MTAIFISHRSCDSAEAEWLKGWLAKQGHERLFLDFDPADGIPAGVDWEQRLYQELRRCQALLIVLTPAWLESKWCGNELAIAREKGKAVFVVRVQPCPGGPVIPAIQEVDLTLDRDAGLEKLARGLAEHGLDPRDAFDWKPDRPIYPGLAAFDVDDAAIFFGRSEESWQVVEALRRMRLQATGSPKLLLITGASGSGKSSLMRAGVLARLRKEPASWITARPFRRGAEALGALAEALAWAFPTDRRPTSLEAIIARVAGPNGSGQLLTLAQELRFAHGRPDATLVLALDQAEELLAAERADDAAKLLDLFRATLAMVGNEILVIATIRSDRLGAWQQHASIKATAEHRELPFEMLPLGPMPMTRIGDLVRGPAAYEGLHIEDDLVDTIRADTVTPDALPLLAYTLQYLHRHFARDGRLTLAEYRSFGGLEGSVRSQADAAIPIEKLSEEDRRALQVAFVPGLVRATAQGGFGRSRALLATLPPRAEPYLRRLIDDARLLTTDIDPQGGVTVEVAHESLLRVWPTLVRWIAEDADSLRRLEAVQRAAQDWAHAGRGQDFQVHRDHRLSDAEALIAEPRFAARLDDSDRDYLAACRNAQNQREAAEKEAQERGLQTTRELAKRRLLLVRGAIAASVVLVLFLGVAVWQTYEARTQGEAAAEQARLAKTESVEKEKQRAEADRQKRLAEEQLSRANDALALGIWSDLDPPVRQPGQRRRDPAPLNPQYRNALWRLARDRTGVRDSFVQHLADGSTNQLRFGAMAPPIVRSLGFDRPSPEEAEEGLTIVVEAIPATEDLDQIHTFAQVASMLAGKLGPEQGPVALNAVLNSIKDAEGADDLGGATGRERVQALAQVASMLAGKLGPEQAAVALDAVLNSIKDTTGRERVQALAQVVVVPTLARRLTPDRAPAALGPVFALFRETNDVEQLEAVTQAMQLLASHLSTEQAQGVLAEILDMLREIAARSAKPYGSAPGRSSQAYAFAQVVPSLVERLAPEPALALLPAALPAFRNAYADYPSLELAMQIIAGKLAPDLAPAAQASILDAMLTTEDAFELPVLAQTLRTLNVTLAPDRVQAVLGSIVARMQAAGQDPDKMRALARTLQGLSALLRPEQAQAAVATVLDTMLTTEDPFDLPIMAATLRTLNVTLAPDRIQALLGSILGRMQAGGQDVNIVLAHEKRPRALNLRALAQTLQALSAPLTPEQAQAALGPVLAAFKGTTDPYQLRELAEAVKALPAELDAEQTQISLGPVLAAFKDTTDRYQLVQLAEAVQALAGKLDAAQGHAALEQILDVLKATEDPAVVQVLAQAVQAVPATLAPEQATIVVVRIWGAILVATDLAQLPALAQAIPAFADKVAPEVAIEVVGEVMEVVSADSSALRAQIMAQAYRALADRLTPEHVQALVDDFLRMTRDGDLPFLQTLRAQWVQALADKLTPAQARALWPQLAEWIGTTGDTSALRDLAAAVNKLAAEVTADQAQAALALARSALAWSGSDDEAAAWASTFVELLLRGPGPNRVVEVVEVLKYPMAGGTGTEILLDALQRADPRSPGKDAGLGANLDWVRQAYPSISLNAAPACPEPLPDRGLSCPGV